MSGFIYVVRSSNGLFKIGYTNDPRRRLTMLRTSTADTLTLLGVVPGTPEDERKIHHLLRRWLVKREWFEPCLAMQPLIDALRPAGPEPKPRRARRTPARGWLATLEEMIAQDGRSMRAISLEAGLGANFLTQLFARQGSASVDTLANIAAVLKCNVTDLLGQVAA